MIMSSFNIVLLFNESQLKFHKDGPYLNLYRRRCYQNIKRVTVAISFWFSLSVKWSKFTFINMYNYPVTSC